MDNIDDIEKVSMRILEKAVEQIKEENKKPKDSILLHLRLGKFSLVLSARQKAKNDWDIIINAKGE